MGLIAEHRTDSYVLDISPAPPVSASAVDATRLDTLVPAKFDFITRRPGHTAVMKSLSTAVSLRPKGLTTKLNVVVMRNFNEEEIVDFVELTRDMDVEVRFIEFMPFSGQFCVSALLYPLQLVRTRWLTSSFCRRVCFAATGNKWSHGKLFSYQEMLDVIRAKYPAFGKVEDDPNDTSKGYRVTGFKGKVGFITSMVSPSPHNHTSVSVKSRY